MCHKNVSVMHIQVKVFLITENTSYICFLQYHIIYYIIVGVCVFVRVFVCHTFYYKNACFVNKVSDVGSWWIFQISFWRMIPIIWHHLQVHQEPPCPPRLQEETWRTGGVLTGFLMLDLDETFTEASEVLSLSYDTTSRFIRNLHILQDSRRRLEGPVESWQMTPPPGSSGTSTSSKTPGRDLEDRRSLDRVSAVSKFFRNLHNLQDSRERLGGQVESWQCLWC